MPFVGGKDSTVVGTRYFVFILILDSTIKLSRYYNVVLLVLSSIDTKSMQLTSISVILLYIDKEIV